MTVRREASLDEVDEDGIRSLPDLFAHALMIEVEAQERYDLLAAQMEMHNNLELAGLFRKLATIEGHHADELRKRSAGMELPRLRAWQYQWPDMESPEAVDMGAAHYRMTAWHALQMALKAERRAFKFFDDLAKSTEDGDVRIMASEFAVEEREHVELVLDLLKRYAEPESDWAEDPDPIIMPE